MINSVRELPLREIKKDLDIPGLMGAATIILSLALVAIGVAGAAQAFQGVPFGLTVLGLSVGITLSSGGLATPATLITAILAILGLAGVLPFGSVGIGAAITFSLAMVGGCIAVNWPLSD
ncbi:MAG: hypothetical protein S4CHLAM2_08010 [Chlamydiales bacterium]|nr:hypothetical protein [Chlamydiales bacterium]